MNAFDVCPLLEAAATAAGYGSIEKWGKAVWMRPYLRCAVLTSVITACRLIDGHCDSAVSSEAASASVRHAFRRQQHAQQGEPGPQEDRVLQRQGAGVAGVRCSEDKREQERQL